jgi:glucan phosphoethanolaminetransferase (alkaline phosphatase superfamily)
LLNKFKSIEKKYLNLFLSITLLSLLLVGSDFIAVHWLKMDAQFPRPFMSHWVQCFFMIGLLSISFSWFPICILISIFLTFSLLQWSSLNFYGSYLSPMMIYLFFRETGEVAETALKIIPVFIKPLIVWGMSLATLFTMYKYLLKPSAQLSQWNFQSKFKKPLQILIVFIFLFPFPRAYFKSHNFGKQAKVHEMSFVNFYGALVYFGGRILPSKLFASTNTTKVVKAPSVKEIKPQRHVIFILGESLASRQMQIFGYPLPTNPHLNELKAKGELMTLQGVSGGVSTDVSIPMLIHGTSGLGASSVIANQSRCLFKLAKQNSFETSFISVQDQSNMQHISNYFCSAYLDHFKIGENLKKVGDEALMLDEDLLKTAEQMNWENPQFAVFHQRGSHSPYELRYPPQEGFREIHPEQDTWEQTQIKHYDNSVRYGDKIIFDLISLIQKKSKIPVEIIMTSDHGEALGEEKHWGHVILLPVVAEVPIVYIPSSASQNSPNFKDVFVKAKEDQKQWVPHTFVSSFLYYLLGYEMEPSPSQQKYFVMGSDIDGLGDFMWVKPQDNHLERLGEKIEEQK